MKISWSASLLSVKDPSNETGRNGIDSLLLPNMSCKSRSGRGTGRFCFEGRHVPYESRQPYAETFKHCSPRPSSLQLVVYPAQSREDVVTVHTCLSLSVLICRCPSCPQSVSTPGRRWAKKVP